MKKMKKMKNAKVLVVLLCAVSMLTGCGSVKNDYSAREDVMAEEAAALAPGNYYSDDLYGYDTAQMNEMPAESTGEDYEDPVTDEEVTHAASKRKLIKTVNMSAQTKEFDKLINTITERIEALGGYAENLDVTGYEYDSSSYSTRHAYIVARIPSNKMDSFVSSVADNSNITSKNERVSDVTLEYSDVEAHKQSLKVEQERLNALIEQADSLETILALEERLTEVRYELESYESRIRMLDNQVDYGTVNLDISEVKDYTPIETEEKSFGQRLSEGFVEGWSTAIEGLGNFTVGFVSIFPALLAVLVVLAIFGGVIFLIIRAIVKASKRGREKKIKKRQEKLENAKKAQQVDEMNNDGAKNEAVNDK